MADESNNRLGRGLAALIGDVSPVAARQIETSASGKRLPVEFIIANRSNPRSDFDESELEDLTNSIREKGVMQPILVRPFENEPDKFEIIAGERRWRAAQRAGLHEVPVIVRDVSDQESLELAIIENVQRSDLNPTEEALGYQQLMDQFEYTQVEMAQVIGKSRSHVANTLRLLKLPEAVLGLVSSGELSAGHARTLITADDPDRLARHIVEKGLSVRDAERLANAGPGAKNPAKRVAKSSESSFHKDADTLALEKGLSDALGLKVDVDHGEEGGQVTINYSTLEQLDEICLRLKNQI